MIKEDSGKFINILSEILKPPFQVLDKLTNYNYQFVVGKGPSELETEEEPPKDLWEKAEIIPIDEYLGLYEPRKIKITIFNKGIENTSRIIKCNPKHLKYIVRLHEWSHALIHIGLCEDDRLQALKEDSYWDERLKQATDVYASIETKLHEHLAQLLTYHSLVLLSKDAKHEEAVDVINPMFDAFQSLNKHQPPEYRIDDYMDISLNRIIESLKLLKRGWLKGVFEAWRTVIKW